MVAALLLVGSCSRKENDLHNVHVDSDTGSPESLAAPPDTFEYIARGNEPFWAVEVTPQAVVFKEPENIEGTYGPYLPPTKQGTLLIFRTTMRDSAATQVELTLDERPCQDSMSGFSFAYTATARIGDRVLTGCGERRPASGDSLTPSRR